MPRETPVITFLRGFNAVSPDAETTLEPDDIRDLLSEIGAAVQAETERCIEIVMRQYEETGEYTASLIRSGK